MSTSTTLTIKLQRGLSFINVKTISGVQVAISENSRRRYPQNAVGKRSLSVVWQECTKDLRMKIERVQNYGMRIILSQPPRTPSKRLRDKLKWMTLEKRREMCRCHRGSGVGVNNVPPDTIHR